MHFIFVGFSCDFLGLLLFGQTHGSVEQLVNLFILDFHFRVKSFAFQRKSTENSSSSFKNADSGFELCNDFSSFFSEDWVRDEEVVFEAFFGAEFRDLKSQIFDDFVFERIQRETQRRILVHYVIEESSSGFRLQYVIHLDCSFKNCCSVLRLH